MKKVDIADLEVGKVYILVNKTDHEYIARFKAGSIRAIGELVSINDDDIVIKRKTNNKNDKNLIIAHLNLFWYNYYELNL